MPDTVYPERRPYSHALLLRPTTTSPVSTVRLISPTFFTVPVKTVDFLSAIRGTRPGLESVKLFSTYTFRNAIGSQKTSSTDGLSSLRTEFHGGLSHRTSGESMKKSFLGRTYYLVNSCSGVFEISTRQGVDRNGAKPPSHKPKGRITLRTPG